MLRVDVGVEKADRNGVDVFGRDLFDDRLEVLSMQRRLDRAVPAQSLADGVNVAGRDERLWLGVVEIVEFFRSPRAMM